jgi:hypothetical protein
MLYDEDCQVSVFWIFPQLAKLKLGRIQGCGCRLINIDVAEGCASFLQFTSVVWESAQLHACKLTLIRTSTSQMTMLLFVLLVPSLVVFVGAQSNEVRGATSIVFTCILRENVSYTLVPALW